LGELLQEADRYFVAQQGTNKGEAEVLLREIKDLRNKT